MAQSIRFHLDEHLHHGIATGLQRRGIDVTTTTDADLIGSSDESQLTFAVQNQRTLVTGDADFLRVHAQTTFHYGIVFVKAELHNKIGLIIRFLEQMWNESEVSELMEQLVFVRGKD